MSDLDISKTREIIEDFALEISKRKDDSKPSKAVINFRNEQKENVERNVYRVPTELLRFRKDNGRIASDVESYEKLKAPLKEREKETQEILRTFLEKKDPEKTEDLTNSLRHDGQKDPAIITADGFLINGNRRKMALEKLYASTKDDRFQWMKVVILPGKDDPGGAPTQKEIEKIENRYQLQNEGKAEYYNFDRALSMRRKIEIGISLEELLRDDPNYANLPSQEFKRKLRKFEEEYLKPLECVDDYLEQLHRQGLYSTISSGMSDPDGKWQAFLDYYKNVEKKLRDEKTRIKMGIDEKEIGLIKDVSFKLIRAGALPATGTLPSMKMHMVMRNMGKWIENPRARAELIKLHSLPTIINESNSEDEIDVKEIDKVWAAENQTDIMTQIHKANSIFVNQEEREGPITLLNAALKRLNDPDLDPTSMSINDLDDAMHLAGEIQKRAHEIESQIYHLKKDTKEKLSTKFKVK